MTRNWLRATAMVLALWVGSLGQPALADGQSAKPSNKWRIEVDHTSVNAGKLVFRITPVQGTPTDVSVSVAEKEHENKIAQNIRDALAAQLPTDRYTVELDDGEDVLIKRQSGQPDFLVELSSTNVKGTTLEVERE